MSDSTAAPATPGIPLTPELRTFVKSFAWFYWGLVISTLFLGVTIMQAWIYFRRNTDRWLLRSVVTLVVALDTTTTVLSAIAGQHWFVDNYDNVLAFTLMPHTFSTETVITVVLTFIVQMFFTYQIWNVSKRNLAIVIPSAFFSIAAFAAGATYSVYIFTDTSVASQQKGGRLYYLIAIGQAMDVGADLVATAGMCFSLWKSASGLKRTDTLIKSLLTYIINRGILVTLFQFMFMILFIVAPGDREWAFFHMQLSKVYTNTMLAILNARGGLRSKVNNSSASGGNSHSGEWPMGSVSHKVQSIGPRSIAANTITIERHVEQHDDSSFERPEKLNYV